MSRLGFVCSACGEVFPENHVVYHRYIERHYWLDESPIEQLEFRACPECGSEEVEEVLLLDESDEIDET